MKASVEVSVFNHVAIVGMGLIGGSIAGAMRKAMPECEIVGVDVDEATRATALALHLADAMYEPGDSRFKDYLALTCDLVILATPVEADEPYLRLIADSGYAGIVTDTSSTKDRIVSMADELLVFKDNFVPGHPMAGSEVNGIEGAHDDLFQGRYWILCPNEATPADHFTKLHEFATSLGARVISLPREQHDMAVAVVSHVPHMVASSLVMLADHASDDQQSIMRIAASGFRDTTRIAAGSPALWCGIAMDNAGPICEGISEMRDILGSIAESIESGDRARLTELLTEASEVRRALPSVWVPSSERLLEVRIPMENRKGVVAEVTTIASSVGCNIQSISIDHVTENRAFLNMIFTDEGDIGKLSAQLIDAGFSISFRPINPKEHFDGR